MTNATNSCTFVSATESHKLLTAAIGTSIAFIGVCCNLVILSTFHFNRKTHNSNTPFLQALAIFDIGVLVCYFLLYALVSFANALGSSSLYYAWVSLTTYLYPFSRMCQMTTTYLVVAVCTQRIHVNTTKSILRRRRAAGKILAVVVLTFVSHISRFAELDYQYDKSCDRFDVVASWLQKNYYYKTIYTLWYTNVANIILPFIILLSMCIKNFVDSRRSLDRNHTQIELTNLSAETISAHQDRLRDMFRVLTVLTSVYLQMNVLSVVLCLIEFIDQEYLDQHMQGWTICVDTINILAVINSSYRIGNYLVFNRQFRYALLRRKKKVAQPRTFAEAELINFNETEVIL